MRRQASASASTRVIQSIFAMNAIRPGCGSVTSTCGRNSSTVEAGSFTPCCFAKSRMVSKPHAAVEMPVQVDQWKGGIDQSRASRQA